MEDLHRRSRCRLPSATHVIYLFKRLRHSYRNVRESVQNRTLANFSRLSHEAIEPLRGHVKGKRYRETGKQPSNPQ